MFPKFFDAFLKFDLPIFCFLNFPKNSELFLICMIVSYNSPNQYLDREFFAISNSKAVAEVTLRTPLAFACDQK